MNILPLDFETFYAPDYSLTKLSTRDYVTDPRFEAIGMGTLDPVTGERKWFVGEEQIRRELHRIFSRPNPPGVLAHNVRFDGAVLEWHFGIEPPFYYDSAAMARAKLSPHTGSVSLAACAAYLGLPAKGTEIAGAKGKRLADFSPQDLRAYAEYCKHDTWLSWEIFKRLLPAFSEGELRIIDLTTRMYVEPRLQLNATVLEGSIQAERARRKRAVDESGVGLSVLRSRDKLAAVMREYGVEPPQKLSPRTGLPTYAMASDDTEFVTLKHHPEVGHLVRARLAVASNIEETRAERLLDRANRYGDLSVPLTYYGAHTGRYTGDERINVLGLSNGPLRQAIQAPAGHRIVAIDYVAIEAGLLAWWSGEEDLCRQFAKGEDVYANFASGLFDITPLTKKTHPWERNIGKVGILSLGYFAGVARTRHMLMAKGIDARSALILADQMVPHYRKTFSRIAAGWYHQGDLVEALAERIWVNEMLIPQGLDSFIQEWNVNEGTVQLPNGMQLVYPDAHNEEPRFLARRREITYQFGNKRKKLHGGVATENWIQALGRIIAFDHMLKLDEHCPAVLQVHDENVFLVPNDEVKDFCELAQQVMTTPPDWAPSLPLSIEIGVGDTYGECK